MTIKILEESSQQALVEKDGRYKIVLITPGQGSSGYYAEDMLRACATAAWPKGSHSYVDHPTEQNPHRSVKDLIGTLDEDAYYEDGVGVVSWLKPRKSMVDFIEEVKDAVGLSIYAAGEGHEEEIDGKVTYVVESLTPNVQNTVDLVAYAGRGGHFTESLIESALNASSHSESSAENKEKENESMTTLEEKVESLISLVEAALSKLEEARVALESKTAEVADTAADAEKAVEATHAVESAELPASMKARLLEGVKSGKYDVETAIESAKKDRDEILAEARAIIESESLGFGGRRIQESKSEDLTVKGWVSE